MWNLSYIKEKEKYIKKELKYSDNNIEKEKFLLTLIGYKSMLNIANINIFSSLLDKISKGKYSMIKDELLNNIYEFNIIQKMDNEFYNFLIKLCFNFAARADILNEEVELKRINFMPNEMINISKNFYRELDNDIYQLACTIYNKKDSIYFSKYKPQDSLFAGVTYNDHIFNDSYIVIYRNNNIYDLIALNHEVMHAIDFKVKPKNHTNNYFGFQEVPTNAIDSLFIDYLVKLGFDKDELYKIQNKSICRTKMFSILTLTKILNELNFENIDKIGQLFDYENAKKVLTLEIKTKLLEIESMILGNYIYDQISSDLSKVSILKGIISNRINPNSIPNFNKYGISNDDLLDYLKNPKKLIKK